MRKRKVEQWVTQQIVSQSNTFYDDQRANKILQVIDAHMLFC